MEFLFWLAFGVVFYTYLGYPLLLRLLLSLSNRTEPRPPPQLDTQGGPEVTFVVAAYNEKDWLGAKVQNCLEQDYPRDKVRYLFVTDGSDDGSPEWLRNLELPPDFRFEVAHHPERRGKKAAIERVFPSIHTPVVVFSDANAMLNPQAVRRLARHFLRPEVGAVAGEKRVRG
ncbi:MAG: glycosyltransferase, partial [Bacteroidetes bacterium]